MTDPNHRVVWKPTRPEFTITLLRSTSTNRGYHESWYEAVSRIELDAGADLQRLDECSLLGIGQAYHLASSGTIVDTVPPVTIDQRTGEVVDAPPVGHDGKPFTNTHDYTYHRYVVKRICDSGD